MSLSHTYDTTRSEITAAMEQRIEKGDRTKLTKLRPQPTGDDSIPPGPIS